MEAFAETITRQAALAGSSGLSPATPAAELPFFPGAGPSAPADYERPQHVDPAVVADIARWLTTAG